MADNYVSLRLKATDDAKPDLEDLFIKKSPGPLPVKLPEGKETESL